MQSIPLNGQTWLICGGRDFTDSLGFADVMSSIVSAYGFPDRVIHGAARGADTLAGEWAKRHALNVTAFPADWNRDGRAAGPIRNQKMLTVGKPQIVIAFPGGRGTADMIRRAKNAGLTVIEVKGTPNETPSSAAS